MRLSEDLAKRFVLGALSEEKRAEIEDLALGDEETFDLLEAMEADLIDRYVRGGLPLADRQAFAERLAPLPHVQERIANARALAAAADEYVSASEAATLPPERTATARHPVWLLPLAATLLIATVGTIVVRQAGFGPWSASAPRADLTAGEPGAVIELAPGALRTTSASQVVKPGDHAWIALRLDLEDPAVRATERTEDRELEIVLEAAARGDVVRQRLLKPTELASRHVNWVVPVQELAPGDYTILLSEVGTRRVLAHYEFTVVR